MQFRHREVALSVDILNRLSELQRHGHNAASACFCQDANVLHVRANAHESAALHDNALQAFGDNPCILFHCDVRDLIRMNQSCPRHRLGPQVHVVSDAHFAQLIARNIKVVRDRRKLGVPRRHFLDATCTLRCGSRFRLADGLLCFCVKRWLSSMAVGLHYRKVLPSMKGVTQIKSATDTSATGSERGFHSPATLAFVLMDLNDVDSPILADIPVMRPLAARPSVLLHLFRGLFSSRQDDDDEDDDVHNPYLRLPSGQTIVGTRIIIGAGAKIQAATVNLGLSTSRTGPLMKSYCGMDLRFKITSWVAEIMQNVCDAVAKQFHRIDPKATLGQH